MTNLTHVPALIVLNDRVFADSRDVADRFGKQHNNVARAVRELIAAGALNFEHTPYVHPQNGETYHAYLMDRDGFTLLVMSFTGKKALKWKMTYIAAFNAMEASLRQPVAATPALTDDELVHRALQITHARVEALTARVAVLEPKAKASILGLTV
jgi:Rha family phage regulatory protein